MPALEDNKEAPKETPITQEPSKYSGAQKAELARAYIEEKDSFQRNIDIHAGARHNRLLQLATLDHVQVSYVSDTKQADSLEGPVKFDKTATLNYHKVTSSQYEQLVRMKSEVADMQRQLTMTVDDYEKKNMPLPVNYMQISSQVRDKEKAYLHSALRVWCDCPEYLETCGDPMQLKDIVDAYDLRTRLSIVNLAPTSSNIGNSSIQ